MLRYNLLFIHVVSAMGIFTALGMEALALAQLRRAEDDTSARGALAALASTRRIFGPSALMLLLSGVWLASAYWRWQGAWMGLGLLALIAVGAIGGVITGRHVSRIQKNTGSGTVGRSLTESLPMLQTSFVIRAAMLVAVVYLMTVKPTPIISLIVLGTSVVAGFLLSRIFSRSETRHAAPVANASR